MIVSGVAIINGGFREYGFRRLGELSGMEFPHGETKLADDFVKREVDEAIEKVVELG